MRAPAKSPTRAASRIQWRVGDLRRTLLILALVLVASAGIALVAALRVLSSRPPAPVEADLKMGSMLIVSPSGNLCQERTIDNDTWRIRDGALVNCAEALARAAGGSAEPSGSRIDLIREGFRNRQ
jgi:hypothetical protein